MARFELNRLAIRDDAALLAEIRRVADLVPGKCLSRSQFGELSRVHASTVSKRFGSWQAGLEAAGLGHRYDRTNKPLNREEIVEELRRVSHVAGTETITTRMFDNISGLTPGPVLREFGSWKLALEAAGLQQASLGKRYSDEECFENLLNVWTHYGRPPKHSEMTLAPSVVGPKAYIGRWGTWLRALEAFVERANSGTAPSADTIEFSSDAPSVDRLELKRGPRDIPLSLRYRVLVRDKFRCVICGQSPATNIGARLHVDHTFPWSKGGTTTLENLRVLCEVCNLGKSDAIEPKT